MRLPLGEIDWSRAAYPEFGYNDKNFRRLGGCSSGDSMLVGGRLLEALLAEDKTGIEQENQTAFVQTLWQRYQPMLEMAVMQLLSLSSVEGQYLARSTYLLESVCPTPGLRLATRLHAIDLDAVPHFSAHLSTGITLDDQAVFAALQKLLAAVPQIDQVNFWLALVVIWIMSVPRSLEVLEGEGIDSPALLQDEPRFRDYLRSEIMQRLTHMY